MPYPRSVAEIAAAENSLVTRHPTLVTRTVFTTRSGEGRQMSYLKLASAAEGPRVSVLFVGGVHARELAPPAALLDLANELCRASAAGTGITLGGFTVSRHEVRRIFDRCDLYLLPMANPDGRDYNIGTDRMWRKSRSPKTCPGPPDHSGTDINRNFDIAWDFRSFYDSAGEGKVSSSDDPCDFQSYIGPTGPKQPETVNVASIIDTLPISWYVDVHSFGPKIYYPWGIEDNGKDPAQNFDNAAFNDRRDGTGGPAYREFFPTWAERHITVANLMSDAIRLATGAHYQVIQSVVDAMTTGASDDYAFSRSFKVPGRRVFAFTIESGSQDRGRFQPDDVQYPGISREIQAALLRLLVYVTPAAGGGGSCPFLVMYELGADAPDVAVIRSWRDRTLRNSVVGRLVIRGYGRIAPALGRFMLDRPRWASVVRDVAVRPLVSALRNWDGRRR